jgi:hypothetical protein
MQTEDAIMTTNQTTAIVQRNNRDEFLALNKALKRVNDAFFVEFNKAHKKAGKIEEHIKKLHVEFINAGRVAGQILLAFAADTQVPGGQITLDFWKKMSGTARNRLHADFRTIQNYQRVARILDHDIKTHAEAVQCRFMWHRMVESEEKRERTRYLAQQASKWNLFADWMDEIKQPTLEALLADAEYFPGGKLRGDLLEQVGPEHLPKLRLLKKILDAYGPSSDSQ